MKLQSVLDDSFARYGRVLEGYDFTELLQKLEEISDKPLDRVIYVPSDSSLEALSVAKLLENNAFGGMPIQIGYCNGSNTLLNCFEYHRDSEINVAADDMILLLASREDIKDGYIDSSKTEAFLCPKGTGIELYATALHYAPCSANTETGFRVVVVLPRNTNTEKPDITPKNDEDALLAARNKWLLAHADSSEAKGGAPARITGTNIDVSPLLPV